MTDAAYCLRETERERKSLARMSRYKKNGSKTKYVKLPQNNMTESEWKKMNGKIYTLTLSKPMDKAEFKSLTPELQREYLLNLATKYEARQIDVARMFGYSQNGMCVLTHKLLGKDTNPFRVGKKPSQKWIDFIGVKNLTAEEAIDNMLTPKPWVETFEKAKAQADTATDFIESPTVNCVEDKLEKKIEAPARSPLSLESLRVRYVGSVTDAFNKVFEMVGNEEDYDIQIELFPVRALPF